MPTGRRIVIAAALAASLVALYFALRTSPRRDEPTAADPPAFSASASGTAGDRNRPRPALSLPLAISLPGAASQPQVFVKPGHWSQLRVEAFADDADFRGDLVGGFRGDPDAESQLSPQIRRRRTIVLPKREPRALELSLFASNSYDQALRPVGEQMGMRRPRGLPIESALKTAQLQLRLERDGRVAAESQVAPEVLRDHQSLLVVLAAKPDAYRFYGKLGFAAAPHASSAYAPNQQAHYRVVVAEADEPRAPLANHFSGWTTTAAVVWDGYDAARLSESQRRAMLDWLHWGGRLIVVGPGGLDSLAGGFLAPYLPAASRGSRELDDAALLPLDDWNLRGAPAARSRPWRGAALAPTPQSRTVVGRDDAPPLVVDRSVGRGHVVVVAFALTQPELVDWPAYDAFINNALLARPARSWSAGSIGEDATWFARWSDNTNWFDSRRTTDVALAARDGDAPHERSEEPLVGPGRAAWREHSSADQAAREILRTESGLSIPGYGFVVGIVAAYIAALVPVNWLLFAGLGKPQWAWATAPIVAVGFSIYIIRAAELDVGFARSAQEIVVVEMQPDYPRAHVSRWGVIYNSLGTDYSFVTTDPSCNVMPPTSADSTVYPSQEAVAGDGATHTALSGFFVDSNSSAAYRAEQFVDSDGVVTCERLADGRYLVRNGTPWRLTDVRVEGDFFGRIESMSPGESRELHPATADEDASSDDKRTDGRSELRRAVIALRDDALRLTAWMDTAPGDLKIEPRLSQMRSGAWLLVHLSYPVRTREHDRNLPQRPQ